MPESDQPAVPPGAQPNPLARCRTHADKVKDLLPGHRDLDGLLQRARGKRRQDRLAVDPELGAEAAADVGRDEPNPQRIDLERAGDGRMRLSEDLRADIDGQIIAIRHCQAAMRLHRLGELIRRRIDLIDLDVGTLERRVEIAHGAVGRKSCVHRFGGVRLVQPLGEVEVSRQNRDLDETRRRARLFIGRRDDERNGFAVMVNVGAAQHRVGARVLRRDRRVADALRRCIAIGHDHAHAGRTLGAGGVDLHDSALADRGADDEAVERLPDVPVFIRIGGFPADLQRAVDAIDRLSGHRRHGLSSPAQRARACGRACASPIRS